MKKVEIDKEELYKKYILENLSRKDCAAFFNVSEKVIIRRLNDFGIKKEHKKIYENIRKTTSERYGVNHPSQSEFFRAKREETMMKRYGVKNTAESEELRNKMIATIRSKYGKKYFVETDLFKNKSSNTCLEKQGVKWPCQFEQCIKALEDSVGHSKPEKEFSDILDKYNIEYEREFPLRGFKYDFKVGNMLFEINPSETHNINFGLFGRKAKCKMYHYTKYSVAKEYGYRCVHIFDWDDSEKIVKLFLLKKERVYARNCDIKVVSKQEAIDFLNENHLQGYARDEIRIGLYEKATNKLVQIMTFGKPRYNKKYQYELVRLCSIKKVVGGAEKILKHFLENYNCESLISYCDLSKFDGKVYDELGFKAINKPKPSVHWVNLRTKQHITDNLLRQKGFDQLFGTNYGKGTSNEELMLNNKFVQVCDCGQLSFALN